MEKELDRLHDQFVLVPADKTGNNIVFVCKVHYINVLQELGFNSASGNTTYTQNSLSKEEFFKIIYQIRIFSIIPTTKNNLNYFTFIG